LVKPSHKRDRLVGIIPAGKSGILGSDCDGTTTAGSLGSVPTSKHSLSYRA
jgi:hypothetical protein